MTGIAPTDIVAALLLCAKLALFLTPLADIKRLAVSFHMRHGYTKVE